MGCARTGSKLLVGKTNVRRGRTRLTLKIYLLAVGHPSLTRSANSSVADMLSEVRTQGVGSLVERVRSDLWYVVSHPHRWPRASSKLILL